MPAETSWYLPLLWTMLRSERSYWSVSIAISCWSFAASHDFHQTAHPFDVTFPIRTDRYVHISSRFEALGIGYVAVNSFKYKDNSNKGRRSLPTKTAS